MNFQTLPALRLLGAALFMLLLLATHPVQAEGRRVALVVGNADYRDRPLKNPGNDAGLMQNVLRGLGFDVVLLRNADRRAFLAGLRDFEAKARDAEVALFFFAGHGVQVGGGNYLIPTGAQIRGESDVPDEAVDAASVLRRIEDARAKVGLVILDACRDNPYGSSSRGGSRGLSRMNVPTGTIVAYATAPGSTAEDGTGGNGVYTQQLAKFLAQPGLDLRDVFDRTASEVERLTAGKQRPREDIGLRGRFYLASAHPSAAAADRFGPSPSVDAPPAARPGALPRVLIAGFGGDDPLVPVVRSTIKADLQRGGSLAVAEMPDVLTESARFEGNRWPAQDGYLLTGSIDRDAASGKINLRYRLWDLQGRRDLGGQALAVRTEADVQLAAHKIADKVQERSAGAAGGYAKRIAWSELRGNQHVLLIANSDGLNESVALRSPQPIALPTWSAEGERLAYFSYESGPPVLYVHQVASGQRVRMDAAALRGACIQQLATFEAADAAARMALQRQTWTDQGTNCARALQEALAASR